MNMVEHKFKKDGPTIHIGSNETCGAALGGLLTLVLSMSLSHSAPVPEWKKIKPAREETVH